MLRERSCGLVSKKVFSTGTYARPGRGGGGGAKGGLLVPGGGGGSNPFNPFKFPYNYAKVMTKDEFLALMNFPVEWKELGMYPDELWQGQLSRYLPGDELGSEHDRNEAFHWWLKRELSQEQLQKLVNLANLDPDAGLGADVRGYLDRLRPYE